MCDKKQYKNNKKTVHCIFASKICQPDYIAKKQAIHRENVQFRTVSQHEQRTNSNINLKFGCRSLDSLFPNGLNSGIIEMVGESGVGKTQLCLQLALMVQLSTERGGLDKKAVFVCTEDAFPSKRLFEIADAFTKRHGEKKYLDNVFIEHVHDAHHLLELVTRRLPILMQKERIGLIVIDSVAGVFRLEADAISRANKMRRLAHALQAVGFDYECAIICINQVTSAIDKNKTLKRTENVPSLGMTWSNLINTRIQVDKTASNHIIRTIEETGTVTEKLTPIRKCTVIFSPNVPRVCARFIITTDGINDFA